MPPANPNTGNVVRFDTHRAISLPPEYAEHLQVEAQEPRLYTGDEVLWGFLFGGLFGALITCASAWVIVGMPT